LDPYPDLQLISYTHLFSRFLLPAGFFRGKSVLDLGCGNGRLAQFIIPDAREYVGIDLSDSILAFEVPVNEAEKVRLIRGSIEDLPLFDRSADVIVCWGALHHVADPQAAIREIKRVVKPNGAILLYVYPDTFAPRENLNRLLKHIGPEAFYEFCVWLSSSIRRWGEIDRSLAEEIAESLSVSLKLHPKWEIFQIFDGLGPAYHHLLEKEVAAAFRQYWKVVSPQRGCFVISSGDAGRPDDRSGNEP